MAGTLWQFNISALPNATDPNAKSPEYIVNKIPTKFCLEPEPPDKRFYKAIFAPHSNIYQDYPSIIGNNPRMAFVWNVRCTKIQGSKITLKFYAEPLWKDIKYYYISFTGDLYSMSKDTVNKVTNVDTLLQNGSKLQWISKKVNGQNERILNYYGLALSYCADSLPTQYNVSNTVNADTYDRHSVIDTDTLSKQDNSFVTSTITLDLTTIPSRELYFKLKFGSWVENAGYARPLTLASVIKDWDWDTEAKSSSSVESPPQSPDNLTKKPEKGSETFSNQYGGSCYYDSGVAWTRIIMPTPRSSIYYYKNATTPVLIQPGSISYYKKNDIKVEPTQNVQVYYYKKNGTKIEPTLVYGYPNSYFYK